MKKYLSWTLLLPMLAWITYFFNFSDINGFTQLVSGVLLGASVLAAVHYSESIAHRIGEPYGTIVLAVSITVIEVALVISLMMSGGEKAMYLARDTVFASVMLLFNAILGICLLVGSSKYFEQYFQNKSVNTSLVSLVAILVLTLVLPNFTTSIGDPRYSKPQLIFVAFACIVIYGTFMVVQTIRHRNYFISENNVSTAKEGHHHFGIIVSLVLLITCLTIVVLLAKSLSPIIEGMVIEANLPQALVGIVIAAVVLLPEGIAAVKAAIRNDIQTSLNLSLGSALAAIGLTIPSVAVISSVYDLDIVLGLGRKEMVLLALSVFTVMLSLSKGKTNILYGVVLIVISMAFIFTTIFP